MESAYKLLRQFRPDEVQGSLAIISGWPVQVVESNEEWRHEAARIKAAGGLSLADSWMAALAILDGAELVHKDGEFDRVAELKSMKL
jgi:predicted nucleic acid-binding protein